MKKRVMMLLTSMLVLGLAGCGGDKNVSGEIKEQQSNESQEQNVDLAIGKAEGNSYKNEFIGIGFTLPDGWSFYNEEQINELNNITQDMLDEEIAEQLKNANVLYDMYALDQYGNSVNINLEKLGTVASKNFSEKTYLESSLGTLEDALKQIGFEDVETEITNTVLGDKEHVSVDIVCTANGFAMYEKVICVKIDKYMANITIATSYENSVDTVLDYFYSLE